MRKPYPTDVSDAEWAALEPFLDRRPRFGPARAVDLREAWNAATYVLGEGCRWRSPPRGFPPHGTVRYYFHKWRREGALREANDALRRRVRLAEGRDEEPSLAILDSQSVRAEKGGAAATTAASASRGAGAPSRSARSGCCWARGSRPRAWETTGGKALPRDLAGSPRPTKALVDGGRAGSPMADLGRSLGIEVEATASLKGSGFALQARRWAVERTFAWLAKCRRLRADCEAHARTGVAWMRAAMVRLMVRRIARAT